MSSWWMNKISEPQPYDPGVLIISHHWLERWTMSAWIAPPETLFSELFMQAWILIVPNSCRTCIMKLQNRKNPDLPKSSQRVGSCAVNSASKPCTLHTHPTPPCSLSHVGWRNSLDCTFQMSPARMFDLWNESKITPIKVPFQTIFNIPLHLPGFRGDQSQLLKSKKHI